MWALSELIEAAARSGHLHLAADALERLTETTQAGDTDFGLGIEARSRALLSQGQAAEDLYREAIDRLGRTKLRPELARVHRSTANGCAGRTAAPPPARGCAPPTTSGSARAGS